MLSFEYDPRLCLSIPRLGLPVGSVGQWFPCAIAAVMRVVMIEAKTTLDGRGKPISSASRDAYSINKCRRISSFLDDVRTEIKEIA